MTGDMFISGGLCKVSLERLFVCLRPPQCINYVKQSLVLTLALLFMVEVQPVESSAAAELSGDMLFWRPCGIELYSDKSSVIQLLVVCQTNLVLIL